jgi:hypothetical protein
VKCLAHGPFFGQEEAVLDHVLIGRIVGAAIKTTAIEITAQELNKNPSRHRKSSLEKRVLRF